MITSPPPSADIQAQMSAIPADLLARIGAANGQTPGAPDPASIVSMLRSKIQQLQQWASEMMPLLQSSNPSAVPLMGPIAQAGRALEEQIAQMETAHGQGGSPGVNNAMLPTGDIPMRAAA